MPDYEAIERKVESDMVRTELEPTPGGWFMTHTEDFHYTARDGKCCLMSPQLLGQPFVDRFDHFTRIAKILGVEIQWVYAAIAGFDGHTYGDAPGHAFGAEMRRKYVTDPAAAQEAADACRERLEDR